MSTATSGVAQPGQIPATLIHFQNKIAAVPVWRDAIPVSARTGMTGREWLSSAAFRGGFERLVTQKRWHSRFSGRLTGMPTRDRFATDCVIHHAVRTFRVLRVHTSVWGFSPRLSGALRTRHFRFCGRETFCPREWRAFRATSLLFNKLGDWLAVIVRAGVAGIRLEQVDLDLFDRTQIGLIEPGARRGCLLGCRGTGHLTSPC